MAKKTEETGAGVKPEETKAVKREIEHIAGVKPDDGKTYLHTNIGFDRASEVKYEIYWLIPATDEEAKERYDCDLATLVESGVRQLTTRPDYKTVGFEENGELKKDGHKFMQAMADNYQVGRVAGEGVKSKAKKHSAMVEKYGGGSEAELQAKLDLLEKMEAEGRLQ